MKILILTYPRIGLNRGGLQLQIEETARGLKARGLEVLHYDPWHNQIPDVDICHVFSIDGSMLQHVRRAVSMGIPVVISSVFSGFRHPSWLTRLKVVLARRIPGMYADLLRADEMLRLASEVIALNVEEKTLLCRAFRLGANKVRTIPNGTDSRFCEADPVLFRRKYGLRDFVLNVASFTENKNQLTLIRAMRDLPYPLVLIGGTPEGRAYLERCRREAARCNVHFIDSLEHSDPLLASAYAAARVFVLPSFSEIMPLALYEAASSRCRLVVSSRVPIEDSLGDQVTQCDPHSPLELAKAIDVAMRQPTVERPAIDVLTWNEVCANIHRRYIQVLRHANHGEDLE